MSDLENRIARPQQQNTPEPRKAAVEAAKARIQPLVLAHLDVAAAAEMPLPAFEAQLTGWVKELLAETKIELTVGEQRALVQLLIADLLGLGPLEPLLADETVTTIMVNGPRRVYIERRGKLELTDVTFRDDAQLYEICTKITNRIGRRIDESRPMIDARLPDGSRANMIMPPLAMFGTAITIHKFIRRSHDFPELLALGTVSPELARALEIAVQGRLNILISGATQSGRTTLLNAIARLIAPSRRVVVIEEPELALQQPHVVWLVPRPPNTDGQGAVTQRELLGNALRMRPDCVLVGEVEGAEAHELMRAMQLHRGSMATIEAASARDALSLVEELAEAENRNEPLRAIRRRIAGALDLVVHIEKLRDGSHRVIDVSEVAGLEDDAIRLIELFAFRDEGDNPDGTVNGRFVSSGVRPRFLPRLERHGLATAFLAAMETTAAVAVRNCTDSG